MIVEFNHRGNSFVIQMMPETLEDFKSLNYMIREAQNKMEDPVSYMQGTLLVSIEAFTELLIGPVSILLRENKPVIIKDDEAPKDFKN